MYACARVCGPVYEVQTDEAKISLKVSNPLLSYTGRRDSARDGQSNHLQYVHVLSESGVSRGESLNESIGVCAL